MRKRQIAALFGALFIFAAIASCNSPAKETHSTDNPSFQVQLLFEKDGVRMYRFDDGGRSHYYAVQAGRTEVMNTLSNGKVAWSETIPTLIAHP